MGHCCRSTCSSSSSGAARPERGSRGQNWNWTRRTHAKKNIQKVTVGETAAPPRQPSTHLGAAALAVTRPRLGLRVGHAGAWGAGCGLLIPRDGGWAARGYSPSSVTLSARAVTPFTQGGKWAFRDSCALGAGAPLAPERDGDV